MLFYKHLKIYFEADIQFLAGILLAKPDSRPDIRYPAKFFAGYPAAGYPALKGQHEAYTAKQLRDYASGARVSDGKTRIMRDIAGKLSEEEIVALASYVQGLK